MDDLELCLYDLKSFQTIWKVSGRSRKCPDHQENVAGLSKFLQNHLLCAIVANLKIDGLYPESFCYKNIDIRKVFAFCDSGLKLMEDGACKALHLDRSRAVIRFILVVVVAVHSCKRRKN